MVCILLALEKFLVWHLFFDFSDKIVFIGMLHFGCDKNIDLFIYFFEESVSSSTENLKEKSIFLVVRSYYQRFAMNIATVGHSSDAVWNDIIISTSFLRRSSFNKPLYRFSEWPYCCWHGLKLNNILWFLRWQKISKGWKTSFGHTHWYMHNNVNQKYLLAVLKILERLWSALVLYVSVTSSHIVLPGVNAHKVKNKKHQGLGFKFWLKYKTSFYFCHWTENILKKSVCTLKLEFVLWENIHTYQFWKHHTRGS